MAVITKYDPVFGPLTYEQGIWTFIPKQPNDGFMVTVDAPASGPTQLQGVTFQKVRSCLADFERRARDFIRSRVEQSDDVSHLSIFSVQIGSDAESQQGRFVLELSDDDAVVIHRVLFAGTEPVDYGFDD